MQTLDSGKSGWCLLQETSEAFKEQMAVFCLSLEHTLPGAAAAARRVVEGRVWGWSAGGVVRSTAGRVVGSEESREQGSEGGLCPASRIQPEMLFGVCLHFRPSS